MIDASPEVYTVAGLNNYIKTMMDNDVALSALFLTGEISNFKAHSSGHMYMSIKDDKSAIRAVMFRGNASRLKFVPTDGMKVILFGNVSVYERDGSYQFYITNMQPDGIGSLSVAFEQLKEKLEREGLFSSSSKKSLPKYPSSVGVVTSPTGAAFQDICNVLGRRWPLCDIVISPALVQGAEAPASIVSALESLDSYGVDVIIVARGGGSIEDLWCFNDESVARAIYACKTPVISGVGHEIDYTIADFVADLRAPTPSAAAEVAVPDRASELDRIAKMKFSEGPISLINERRIALDTLSDNLNYFVENKISSYQNRLALLSGKLDAYSPLKVLSRGYSIVESSTGIITGVDSVSSGDKLSITVADGKISATVD